MKRNRKLVMAALTLLLLPAAPFLFAGGQQEVEDEKNVIVYNSFLSDPDARVVDEALVEMYQDRNPHVTVVHSIVAHETYKDALPAYLRAENPPDVLTWMAGETMRFYAERDLLLDLTDLWADESWDEDYTEGFRELSSYEGVPYFVPTNYYWWAVYYQKSVFEEHGLEPPETWDEFLEVCETLKANGVTPFTIGTRGRWTAGGWFDILNMRVNGPEFHMSLMDGNESYNDPRVLDVFENYWRPLIDNGYFIDDAAAYSWSEAIPFMTSGEAAMFLMGDFIRDAYPAEYEDDLGFFQFPIIDPNIPVGIDAPTDGFMIPANTRNPELAKDFVAFMGSLEAQEYMAQELGRLGTHSKIDRSILTESQIQGIELVESADVVAQFYGRDTHDEMQDRGYDAFVEFWENTGDAQRILDRLEEDRVRIFQ